jgi:hypothetical protein
MLECCVRRNVTLGSRRASGEEPVIPQSCRSSRDFTSFNGAHAAGVNRLPIVAGVQCQYSPEGRVAFLSGAMIPCWITETWLCNRIDEWHCVRTGSSHLLVLRPCAEIRHRPPARATQEQHRAEPQQIPERSVIHTLRCAVIYHSATRSLSILHISTPTPSQPVSSPNQLQAHLRSTCDFADTYPPTVLSLQAPMSSVRQVPNPQVAEETHERALEDPIAITQRGLFSLTPEVWTKVTEVTVRKHFLTSRDYSNALCPPRHLRQLLSCG